MGPEPMLDRTGPVFPFCPLAVPFAAENSVETDRSFEVLPFPFAGFIRCPEMMRVLFVPRIPEPSGKELGGEPAEPARFGVRSPFRLILSCQFVQNADSFRDQILPFVLGRLDSRPVQTSDHETFDILDVVEL